MIVTIALDEIRQMTVTERLKLLGDIWETLMEEQAPLPLSDAETAQIDRRVEAYRQHGDRGISWDELERRFDGE